MDRCQRGAFFQFNCANQDLGPEALNFIERLAGAISPSFERSKEQILGEKLDYATRLVFVPSASREKDEPLDLHKEVFISHCGVFLDIGQFAVYVSKILKPKGSPSLSSTAGRTTTSSRTQKQPKGSQRISLSFANSNDSNGCTLLPAKLITRARQSATTGRFAYHMLARRALNMNGLVMSIKGRQGPYGKGKGGQERQKGSEGKGKSSGKGKGKQGNFKGKQGKSPPGGVTFSLHRQERLRPWPPLHLVLE